MSFAIYMIGFLFLIGGLAYGASLAGLARTGSLSARWCCSAWAWRWARRARA